MFEDSTFASTGKVRMRTRAGFYAAFAFEGAIVAMMVLIPLLYPHALPNMVNKILMEVPPTPIEPPKPLEQHPAAARLMPAVMDMGIHAPTRIPIHIYIPDTQEPPRGEWSVADMAGPRAAGGGGNSPFGPAAPVTVVQQPVPRSVRLSSMVVEGLLVHKTIPVYPVIAKATHTQGTVVLQATISRTGTIENLRVASGAPMLEQAALDAVSTWRYRPYLLNGQPIEVETTVSVVFKLGE